MEGKYKRKNVIALTILICFAGIFAMSAFFIREYQNAVFKNISAFCELMTKEEPESVQLVLSSLKKYQTDSEYKSKNGSLLSGYGYKSGSSISGYGYKSDIFLTGYGYESSDFAKSDSSRFMLISAAVFIMTVCGFIFALWYMDKYSKMRIAELTDYLEKVNIGDDAAEWKKEADIGEGAAALCGEVNIEEIGIKLQKEAGAGTPGRILQKEAEAGTPGRILQAKDDEFSLLEDEMHKTITNLYQTREAALTLKSDYADNLANIAHQLKTSITAALLSLELMKKENNNIYVNRIEKQLDRLKRLEESLLILSEIDAGVLKLDYKPVDIYTLLNLAADNLSEMLIENKVAIDIRDKGCTEFFGDMEWMMEAVINIMKNCMENSPPNRTIHCEYSFNPIYAEIIIWDEGTGFEDLELPRIFERFYRGKRAFRQGIGIGLSLAKSIIELQNGTISARNLPQGGACFEIRMYSH